jgi:hypothetical protein
MIPPRSRQLATAPVAGVYDDLTDVGRNRAPGRVSQI